MTHTVHSYIRKRGSSHDDPVDLYYLTTGKHLQEDMQTLAAANLPKPDLLRGVLHCSSLDQASKIVALQLHGLYTREVTVDDGDTLYADYPEFVGPPRITLRAPRPPRPGAAT